MKKWQIGIAIGLTVVMLLFLLRKPIQRFALSTAIKMVGEEIPTISPVKAMAMKEAVFLDTRSKSEYEVSHIGGALRVGYDDFSMEKVSTIDSITPIIVYCTIGARSKDIGKKLVAAGHQEVYNLRGGIFRWMDEGLPVENRDRQLTDKVHPYNWFWGLFAVAGEKRYQ